MKKCSNALVKTVQDDDLILTRSLLGANWKIVNEKLFYLNENIIYFEDYWQQLKDLKEEIYNWSSTKETPNPEHGY